MGGGGRGDEEPTHQAAQGCSFNEADRAILSALAARGVAQSVSQQDLARQLMAHTVRSTHTAQFVIPCIAAGAVNIAFAIYLYNKRILDAMDSIGSARISLIVWVSVLLLGVSGAGCAVLGFKQPPLTATGLKRFARWRFWALLASIAMSGIALCVFKK